MDRVKRTKTRYMLLVIAFVITMMSASVAALGSFSFTFTPPIVGAARNSGLAATNGAQNPYIQLDGSTARTIFCFVRLEGTAPYTDNVTNINDNITGGKTYFSYNTGYGGLGQYYMILGLPYYYNFLEYSSSGVFQP